MIVIVIDVLVMYTFVCIVELPSYWGPRKVVSFAIT